VGVISADVSAAGVADDNGREGVTGVLGIGYQQFQIW
jgi:hypothetical protein